MTRNELEQTLMEGGILSVWEDKEGIVNFDIDGRDGKYTCSANTRTLSLSAKHAKAQHDISDIQQNIHWYNLKKLIDAPGFEDDKTMVQVPKRDDELTDAERLEKQERLREAEQRRDFLAKQVEAHRFLLDEINRGRITLPHNPKEESESEVSSSKKSGRLNLNPKDNSELNKKIFEVVEKYRDAGETSLDKIYSLVAKESPLHFKELLNKARRTSLTKYTVKGRYEREDSKRTKR